ncbi:hypothetical protein R6Q59_006452 [Mikania micrantha]
MGLLSTLNQRSFAANPERRLVPIDTPTHASSSNASKTLMVQNDEGKNWDFRFNPDQGGHDKACVAEIQKIDESSEEITSEEAKTCLEESSGSESESTSDLDTQGDSVAELKEPATHFAMTVNTSATSQSEQVFDECSSSHSRCFNCIDLEITSYLNTINGTKKKLAIVEYDYETLSQKLKSYERSSYIIEHMISNGTDQAGKSKDTKYNHCPPPVLNCKGFQVKIPLVIDPIGII